ncbi:MAG: PilZ domain-containing protein [Deltaproteobacteria bacterium]|nr:PilZ domain-containing protein [Deltaproteobacteria bacterium]
MSSQSADSRARRVEQRVSRRRVVPVRCWVADGLVARYASLADISLDGARVLTTAPPSVGQLLSLRFRLRASGEEVRASGRVVWRSEGFRGRGGVMGVHFTEIAGAEEIAAYINGA